MDAWSKKTIQFTQYVTVFLHKITIGPNDLGTHRENTEGFTEEHKIFKPH